MSLDISDPQLVNYLPLYQKNWCGVALTAASITAGLVSSQTFAIGLVAGTTYSLLRAGINYTLFRDQFPSSIHQLSDKQRASDQYLIENFFFCTIIGPIVESAIFHGFLQNTLAEKITLLSSCQIESANHISVVATSFIFGAIHLPKSEYQAKTNVIHSLICYGPLSLAFGLPATIGAHIAHNVVQILGETVITL